MIMRANERLKLQKQQQQEEEKKGKQQQTRQLSGSLVSSAGNSYLTINSGLNHQSGANVVQLGTSVPTPFEMGVRAKYRLHQPSSTSATLGQNITGFQFGTTSQVFVGVGAPSATGAGAHSLPVDFDTSFYNPSDMFQAVDSANGMDMLGFAPAVLDQLLQNIDNLEVPEVDLEPSLPPISQTLPHEALLFENLGILDIKAETGPERIPASWPVASSALQGIAPAHRGGRQKQPAPAAFKSNDEQQAYERERQKKDNHNKIERRRRYNINDRIKDLECLLHTGSSSPSSDTKYNKGTVLKEAVDFIKKQQREQFRTKAMEEQRVQLEAMNRRLVLHIGELERLLNDHGIAHSMGTSSDEFIREIMALKDLQSRQQQQLQQQQSMYYASVSTTPHNSVADVDELMDNEDDDDNSYPVSANDPLMMSASCSPQAQHLDDD